MSKSIIPAERIENAIVLIRDTKVMLDADIARLYGVETRALVQAVKRNGARFPADFMFQLTDREVRQLRSQSVIVLRKKHYRFRPYAFTENGVAMLSSVLNSERAITVNIEIMRAFTNLRRVLASNVVVAQKLDELESRLSTHDSAIRSLFTAIKELMKPDEPKRKPVGFKLRNGNN